MPDPDESTTAELFPEQHPAPKTVRWTERVAGWLKDTGKKLTSKKWFLKWLGIGVLGLFAFLLLAFVVKRLRSQEKKIADLLHEHEVFTDQTKRIKALAAMAVKEDEAARFEAAAEISKKQVEQLEIQLQLVRDAKVKTEATIAAIKSWRDVDNYLAGKQ